MGESQSRYSIVERLTKQKLDIMTAKSELKAMLKDKEQNLENLKVKLENWDKDVEEDIARTRRIREREIIETEQETKYTEETLSDKEKTYDEKIKAIEDALKSIEEISKTSPTIQS